MISDINTIRKSEEGFTLVELAVVMIIIGLLIAGILKGQELIANARVTSTISQMQGIAAAVDGFQDAYNAFPGDMGDAETRLVNCDSDLCANGGGNGRISVAVGAEPVVGAGDAGEGVFFFTHMAAADFITGVDGSGDAVAFGRSNPTAPVGGGFGVGYTGGGLDPTGFNADDMRVGTYIFINGIIGDVAEGSGVLSASQAARIDRKLDDGVPNTGVVVGDASAACQGGGAGADAPPIAYQEADASAVCAVAFRM